MPLTLITMICPQNCWISYIPSPFPSPVTSLGSYQPQKEQPPVTGMSWGKRGAQQQGGPTGTRILGAAPRLLGLPLPNHPHPWDGGLGHGPLARTWPLCHRPPRQSKPINNGAGNNSSWKARTTQHLQMIGFAGSSGFLQDLFPSFPSLLFQLAFPHASR